MQRPLRLLPVIALIVLGAFLAACGGSDLASDPGQVLADAKQQPAGPAKSSLQIQFTPQAAAVSGADSSGADGLMSALTGGPISITATTQGDVATALTADAKLTIGPIDVPVSIRTTEDNAYLQAGGAWYETGSPLGIDVGSLTGAVGDVSKLVRDPKAVAVEDVDGIQCDRITGTIDPGAALTEQLSGLASNLPIDLSALAKGDAEVSIWVGRSDHVIHRVQINTAGSGDAAATSGLLLDVTTVPSDAVVVQAPADAKPISDLLSGVLGQGGGDGLGGLLGNLDLGQLLGGAGGAGGLDLGKILGGATTGSST